MGRPAKRVVILDKDEDRGGILRYVVSLWSSEYSPLRASCAHTPKALRLACLAERTDVVIAVGEWPEGLAWRSAASPDARILAILPSTSGAAKGYASIALYDPTQNEIHDAVTILLHRKRGPRKGASWPRASPVLAG